MRTFLLMLINENYIPTKNILSKHYNNSFVRHAAENKRILYNIFINAYNK